MYILSYRRNDLFKITRSNFDEKPKYRLERCERVRGFCKTFCDDDEYDYGYCVRWRKQCCI
ncbi:beta-defensin 110-like [Myotis daubentonii]|uniref:beta-defensin 110-like n=1 Tax=Myotis daubentonii TaxID=98922 RepID=UPI00287353E6|nr:beta-defensin 110-like [Myotis daubentonii]